MSSLAIAGSVGNELARNRPRQGKVTRRLDLGHAQLNLISDNATKLPASLVPDDCNVRHLTLIRESLDTGLDVTGDEGVDTAAQSLIGRDRYDQALLGQFVEGGILEGHGRAVQRLGPSVEGYRGR